MTQLDTTRKHRVWMTFWRMIRMELMIYASIGRAIVRRPAIAPGGSGFSYHRPVLTILIVFIMLSAIEIPIVDLIVHQWVPVRIFFLILGIWGVTWMIGLLCAYFMRPHTVGPAGIRVREGLEIDIPLSWDDVAAVSKRRHIDEPKTARVMKIDGRPALALRMQNETNVEIELERRTFIRLPGYPPKGGAHEVSVVRIWVDDLEGFMASVREHIP